MQKTELQIVFYLLQDKENTGKTFRDIAEATGVSLGAVHGAISALTEQGYIIDNGERRVIRKRNLLIDRWVFGYVETLKPKLFLGRFTFLNADVKARWRDIVLPSTLSWGGEPAAALTDGYIAPERWDIYTADNANALISTARMIPSPQGEIFVYKRFWKTEGTPPLIVYADLLATNDDRCREAAERIKQLI